MARPDRIRDHHRVSAELAGHGDRQLGALVDRAQVLGTGIGGTSALLHVRGRPVFAKRIRLTDRERLPAHVGSTANLFGLPAYCQYGVGSPGFGAWRELASNSMTTTLVLAGRTGSFPLLHHWRVLPGVGPPPQETADPEATVAYWGGATAVRERFDALAHASASLVLFLEYVPDTLDDWLDARGTNGETACAALGPQLLDAVALMNAHGLTHFDAHLGNVLTDGHRLFLTDLGLATSPRFDLSADEASFLGAHRDHDTAYVAMRLVNRLVTAHLGAPGGVHERDRYVRACAAGAEPDGTPEAAALIRRYAPVAAVMNGFYRELFVTSRTTPYPAEAVSRALAGPG